MTLISWFDNRTLLACQTLLAIIFTIVFFGVRRTYPELRGVLSVALSFLFGIPGVFLLCSRPILTGFASTVIAVSFIFAAFTLLYRGILRFLGSRQPIYPVWIASLLTIAVVAYFTLVREDIVPSIVAVSFAIALIRGLIAIELFRHSNGRSSRQMFAISMAAFALMSLGRGVVTLLHGAPANYLQRDGVQTFTLAAGLVSVCLTGLFFLTMCNGQAVALIRNESEHDLLSGAFNRRGIEMRLDIELKRTARSGEPLSIALIDVDHFKLINDTVGHAAGDSAIRSVAKAISGRLRAYDSLGRFGGDEFLLILPKTRCTDAQLVVDRLALFVADSVSSAFRPPTDPQHRPHRGCSRRISRAPAGPRR